MIADSGGSFPKTQKTPRRAKRDGEFNGRAVFLLLADSDDLDLAKQLLGQLLHGNAGTGGLAGEILAVRGSAGNSIFCRPGGLELCAGQ